MSTSKNPDKFNFVLRINNLVGRSSRIEQVYLVIDRIVSNIKSFYPGSLCLSCPLTCCINDLFLPVSYLEWKAIETYLEKSDPAIIDQLKENIATIDADLFKDIKTAEPDREKYKNSSCPLLINNRCSIGPYRPVSCRTYGLFFKNDNPESNEITGCEAESVRFSASIKPGELLLVSLKNARERMAHLNAGRPDKLLIVWLRDYLSN